MSGVLSITGRRQQCCELVDDVMVTLSAGRGQQCCQLVVDIVTFLLVHFDFESIYLCMDGETVQTTASSSSDRSPRSAFFSILERGQQSCEPVVDAKFDYVATSA